jgi:hypothetical protein
MQAWNAVKVINEESVHNGRAGMVVRVEKLGDEQMVQVKLDEIGEVGTPEHKPAETEPFDAAELRML